MSPFFTFSRWDGSQAASDSDDDVLVNELSEGVLARGDVSSSLRAMVQRGIHPQDGEGEIRGIQDLLQQLRADRQQMLRQNNLGSLLDDLRARLDDVIRTEREGMERRRDAARAAAEQPNADLDPDTAARLADRVEDMVRRNEAALDTLPPDLGGAVRDLNEYEFMEPDAQRLFDELKQLMQQQFVDRQFQQLTSQLEGMSGQNLEQSRAMMRDLNEMLERHVQGDDDTGFNEFMGRWGAAFGDDPPETIDRMVETLQNQAAQTRSLMNSLSAEQRRQLQGLIQGALDDPALLEQMAALQTNLDALSVGGEMGRRFPFQGEDPVSLQEALGMMDRLNHVDDLERQLKRGQYGGGGLDEIDSDDVRELLGDEAAESLEALKRLTQRLEEAGIIRPTDGDRYELTPRGIRRIGHKALMEIFSYIRKSYGGRHLSQERGRGGEPTEATKPYTYGDQFTIDLRRTIHSAVVRSGGGTPVKLEPSDFEVHEMEEMAQSSTVLMVDLSLSMAMRGNFVAAKKVALALDTLIRTQFNRDTLYLVGFSTYAREMKPEGLAYLNWDEFEPYTNIQHGLAVSQKLLSRHSGTKQIIIVSDGEPTAHMEAGQLFLQYPPSARTIRETLKEVRRATRSGISINTFMLEQSSFLMGFVDEMTRINKGRVFYTTSEHLGEYILVDYLTSRRRRFVA